MKTFKDYIIESKADTDDLLKVLNESELSEEQNAAIDEAVQRIVDAHNNGQNLDEIVEEIVNEGILGSIFGGLTGFALGKSIGEAICKVLGIEKGALYDLLTSRLVGAALGAVAAAAVMMAGFSALNSVGDLGIDANGGPVVMSPQENSIFQGTKNDDLAMYPGATDAAQNNGTTVATTSVNIDYDRLADAVTRSIEKLRIIIDESAVNAIAQKGAVRASFK